MPVSKTRCQRSSQQIRRARERLEVQRRARSREASYLLCLARALCRVYECSRLEDIAEALRELGRLSGTDTWPQLTAQDLEPDAYLTQRPGWRCLYDELDMTVERWIYDSSSAEHWDESAAYEPTEVLWDGKSILLTLATGPDHLSRGSIQFDNVLCFYLALPEVESW